jgi:hypothetical protein
MPPRPRRPRRPHVVCRQCGRPLRAGFYFSIDDLRPFGSSCASRALLESPLRTVECHTLDSYKPTFDELLTLPFNRLPR